MKKKQPKEPVRLRSKRLASGGESLYLDYYAGGSRRYEFLRLYLVPEHNREDREKNRQTLATARTLLARRVVECQQEGAGLAHGRRIRLSEWMRSCGRGRSAATVKLWGSVAARLEAFAPTARVMLQDVDAPLLRRFAASLSDLSPNSRMVYWSKIRAAMSRAEREGMVPRDPCRLVEGPKGRETRREHLTAEELRALASTPCRNPEVRRAFLFSCLTGLRVSDIRSLAWGDVGTEQGRTRLTFRQRKTSGLVYLDLSAQAESLLGERGEAGAPVFHVPEPSWLSRVLARWTSEAGIGKHITFHCARHTFAVLQLASGTDIYTVSRLLGHSDVKTTQAYAKVLDQARREAVDRMPNIL